MKIFKLLFFSLVFFICKWFNVVHICWYVFKEENDAFMFLFFFLSHCLIGWLMLYSWILSFRNWFLSKSQQTCKTKMLLCSSLFYSRKENHFIKQLFLKKELIWLQFGIIWTHNPWEGGGGGFIFFFFPPLFLLHFTAT